MQQTVRYSVILQCSFYQYNSIGLARRRRHHQECPHCYSNIAFQVADRSFFQDSNAYPSPAGMLAAVRPNFAPLQAQIPERRSTNISASSSPLSSPTTPLERRLYPRPLNIFKRPSRRSLVRHTTPVNSIPESISEAEDTALIPRPLSIASTPAPSPTQPPNNATSPHTTALAPASLPPSNPASPPPSVTTPPPSQPTTPTPSATPLPPTPTTTTCTLCFSPLLPLQTYTLPKTAPSLTSKIHTLYPTIPPTTPTPTFCTSCFTTIRSLVLCWGCGDPIHRPEERVGCGWAWWHWGCVRCLLCRVGPAPSLPPIPIPLPIPSFSRSLVAKHEETNNCISEYH